MLKIYVMNGCKIMDRIKRGKSYSEFGTSCVLFIKHYRKSLNIVRMVTVINIKKYIVFNLHQLNSYASADWIIK